MALLERVSTLLRANLNDLIDRAENPETMVKQIILDMENQLMQVKTQIAISVADLHLLKKKRDESITEKEDYIRKAQLAITKENDALARGALERSIDAQKRADAYEQQITDQTLQVDNLKAALQKLQTKLTDARTSSELMIARHHRARAASNAAKASIGLENGSQSAAWDRMKHNVNKAEAIGSAYAELAGDKLDDQFAAIEKEDQIERLLSDLKNAKG
jgi:phage shock protein A